MNNVIHRFRNSSDGEVRISNLIHKNKSYVDIRVYARPVPGRKFMPTSKGLIVDANFLPDLVRGFEKSLEEIVVAIDGSRSIARKANL
jgi:hypothetical protein